MLSCQDTTQMCSDELDRPLRLGERVALRTHLMMCDGCSRYRRQLQTLRLAMGAYANGDAVTTDPSDDSDRPDQPHA